MVISAAGLLVLWLTLVRDVPQLTALGVSRTRCAILDDHRNAQLLHDSL